MTHDDARVQRVIDFFETLTPVDVASMDRLYAPQATFKDPFNEVQGVAAIQGIFAHMFVSLDDPRFVIVDAVAQEGQCFLRWEMHFRMKRLVTGNQVIRGASHLRFASDGRIAMHRDYWDAAEELYEKLPGIGVLMRWLKRRAGT